MQWPERAKLCAWRRSPIQLGFALGGPSMVTLNRTAKWAARAPPKRKVFADTGNGCFAN
jgi:hypothetical protein